MPRAASSRTPLEALDLLGDVEAVEEHHRGRGPALPAASGAGCTNSAGKVLSPYGTSTASIRGRFRIAAPSANDFTAFL